MFYYTNSFIISDWMNIFRRALRSRLEQIRRSIKEGKVVYINFI